jgi:hypothetical protein
MDNLREQVRHMAELMGIPLNTVRQWEYRKEVPASSKVDMVLSEHNDIGLTLESFSKPL